MVLDNIYPFDYLLTIQLQPDLSTVLQVGYSICLLISIPGSPTGILKFKHDRNRAIDSTMSLQISPFPSLSYFSKIRHLS